VNAVEIEVRLAAAFGGFELDVEIETRARCLGVFGPSGSGKTSLLEAVAGWRTVRSGRIRFGERILLDTSRGVSSPSGSRRVGYVPQDALLFPHWTVRRNVLAGAQASEAELRRAAEVLEIVPLLDRSTPALSGGEKSRVAIARALCSRPEILLLDEPFGALDLPLRRRILPYLLRARDAYGLPTLFVSHDPTEVLALCDVVAVLERGRVRAVGRPEEVLHGPGMPMRGSENVLSGDVVDLAGGTARVEVAPGVVVLVPASGLARGDRAVFALGADEILVSNAPIAGLSARNLLAARIDRVQEQGNDVLLEVAVGESEPRARLYVGLTRIALQELRLREGSRVVLVFKTQSCRVVSAAEREAV
jgi:molybdate transport system ATP-binding protein